LFQESFAQPIAFQTHLDAKDQQLMGFFAEQFKGGFCDLQYQHNSFRRADRTAARF
jgi:hypothetical protein